MRLILSYVPRADYVGIGVRHTRIAVRHVIEKNFYTYVWCVRKRVDKGRERWAATNIDGPPTRAYRERR